jgi:hypothetical protein
MLHIHSTALITSGARALHSQPKYIALSSVETSSSSLKCVQADRKTAARTIKINIRKSWNETLQRGERYLRQRTQNRYLAPQLVHLDWGKGARGAKITASHHFSPFRHSCLSLEIIVSLNWSGVFAFELFAHKKNIVIYCLQRPICILFKLVHPSHSRSNNLSSQFHWHSLFGKYLRYAQQPPVKLHHEGLLRSMCRFCKQQGAGTRTLNLTNCEPRELI